MDPAASIEYLRQRGVEVDLPEERAAAKAPRPSIPGAQPFTFIHIPADVHTPIASLEAAPTVGDALPSLLAPCFASDEAMDPTVVMRESSARLKNMVLGGGLGSEAIRTPSASAIQQEAAGGACEAYPLAPASEANGWKAVRLYIDEVGALRNRPRNARAEALAAAAGLAGLSIHGDAYLGRCQGGAAAGGERNVSLAVDELAHDSAWVRQALQAHQRQAAEAGHGDAEHLAQGEGELYSWKQGDDDLEVRVKGAPEGRGAARRVLVSYGSGDRIEVKVDGAVVLFLSPLFDRVAPDECTWTLDKAEVVITLEKAQARPWTDLVLPGGSATQPAAAGVTL